MDKKISAKSPKLTKLKDWLEEKRTDNGKDYLHILLSEKKEIPQEVWDELYEYIKHAHEGARQSLRTAFEHQLHPFKKGTIEDPVYGYPYKLNIDLLKGYFGEIMAGIIASNYKLFNLERWQVPVHIFRTHDTLFDQLEEIRQTNNWNKKIPGRTGDDHLAFMLDDNGTIIGWINCEAKCTSSHNSTLINKCFKKLSSSNLNRPVSLKRLLESFKDYKNDQYRKLWENALIEFRKNSFNNKHKCEYYDLGVYVYGQKPKIKKTWIPCQKKPEPYKKHNKLCASEVYLVDVENKIKKIYNKMNDTDEP